MRSWSKPMRVTSGVGFVILLLTGFVIVNRLTRPEPELPVAALVDGEPIYAAELSKSMERQRHSVAMDYYHTYGVEESPAFWTSEYEGATPLDVLREKALQQVVRVKQLMILARGKGLIEDISYPAMLESLAAENKRRSTAASRGEVIYGPLQYTEEAYTHYVMANLQVQLRAKLEGAEIPLSDTLLQRYYDSVKAQFYMGQGAVRVHTIRMSYVEKDGTVSREKQARALEGMKEVQRRLEEGDSFAALAEQYNETEEEKSSRGLRVFDRTTARADQLSGGGLREAAMKLAAGRTSGIVEANNAVYLLNVLEKLPAQAQPFDQVKGDVKNKYAEQEFNRLIDRLTLEAEVEIKQSVYDSVMLP